MKLINSGDTTFFLFSQQQLQITKKLFIIYHIWNIKSKKILPKIKSWKN